MTAPEPIPPAPDRAGQPENVDQHTPADVMRKALQEAIAEHGKTYDDADAHPDHQGLA